MIRKADFLQVNSNSIHLYSSNCLFFLLTAPKRYSNAVELPDLFAVGYLSLHYIPFCRGQTVGKKIQCLFTFPRFYFSILPREPYLIMTNNRYMTLTNFISKFCVVYLWSSACNFAATHSVSIFIADYLKW